MDTGSSGKAPDTELSLHEGDAPASGNEESGCARQACSFTDAPPEKSRTPYLQVRNREGKKQFVSLPEGSSILGRNDDAAIRLEDKTVSGLHATFVVQNDQVQVIDLGSTNGVKVNGGKIRSMMLKHGDRLRIGGFSITLCVPLSQRAAENGASAFGPSWFYDMPYWAVSALLHGIVLLLVGAYVITEARPEKKVHSFIMTKKYDVPPYDPTLKRAMERTPEVLHNSDERKLIKQLKPQEIAVELPKGSSFDNMSNKELQHKGPVDVFGVGGGAAGAYGHRFGKDGLVREGGGEGTEKAVLAALLWLQRHQSPDGRWSSHDFIKQCDPKKGPCTNKRKRHGDGRGMKHHDVGITALALLAFTGAGHTHQYSTRPGFAETVRKGMRYLKRVQKTGENDPERGRFATANDNFWIYDQALATMALGELLVLTCDVLELARPVQYAAELCLKAQNKGLAWRYGIRPGDNDTSISGWMVLALKTCKVAGISAPPQEAYDRAFKGALRWFRKVADPDRGSTGYQSARENRPHSTYCMSSVGVLCRLFAGERRSSPFIRKGSAYILQNPPEWKDAKEHGASKINFYYWYYGTYALFQNGGRPWEIWNKAMRKALLSSQRVSGCEDGSWDPIGQWSDRGGRVYSTALGAMTLEVYYRFVRATGREL